MTATGEQRLRRNLRKRKRLWPDLKKEMVWDWKDKKGFTTIPRTLPYVFRIMDSLGGNRRLSPAYFALWCRVWDQSCLLKIDNPIHLAWESGYVKQRALDTWRDRMKRLKELGFIDSKPLANEEFGYVLLISPYYVVKNFWESGKYSDEGWYNAFVERTDSIGATDLDEEED